MTAVPFTRLGFQFVNYSFRGVPDALIFDHVVEIAQAAEASGFDSLWVMDHVQQVATVGRADEPVLEAYTTLAGLAMRTTAVRLGVLVSPVGFRNPAMLAKTVTTLDVMSGGRAILGLGAGWWAEEFAAYGLPFADTAERLGRLAEAVEICRAMFAGAPVDFDGAHYRLAAGLNVPAPVATGGPPILVGGGGERVTIPLVARLADGCNFFGGPATVRRKLGVLDRECERIGRDPSDITRTWLGTAAIADSERELRNELERLGRLFNTSPDAARAFTLCGSGDDLAEQAGRYRELGIDAVIVNMDDAHELERVRRIGGALAAGLR